jgi:hypothetical protein
MLASFSPKRRLLNLIEAHKFALGQTAHRYAPELSRRTPRPFLATVNAIAKHFRYDVTSAKKMHLETVGLFLRASFRIDPSDVRFRIRVGFSSHHKQEVTRN